MKTIDIAVQETNKQTHQLIDITILLMLVVGTFFETLKDAETHQE